MFQVRTTWGCICREGRTCAYHATIKRITDNGGDLSLRLAVIDHSTIPEQQREAAIIRAELTARRRARGRQAPASTHGTHYFGPGNVRGARIIATTTSGIRHTIGYPHELSGAECHRKAAHELAELLGWKGDMICGATKRGYVFVFAN